MLDKVRKLLVCYNSLKLKAKQAVISFIENKLCGTHLWIKPNSLETTHL